MNYYVVEEEEEDAVVVPAEGKVDRLEREEEEDGRKENEPTRTNPQKFVVPSSRSQLIEVVTMLPLNRDAIAKVSPIHLHAKFKIRFLACKSSRSDGRTSPEAKVIIILVHFVFRTPENNFFLSFQSIAVQFPKKKSNNVL